ncbi:hypothetical protein [Pseudomonas indica]|uniref:hypothetical protein n=1 Tax=Pseudomonas indica TaxID=137658 RepID=UPI0011146179|nr:hypothetical protein [Pseudomonas indica]
MKVPALYTIAWIRTLFVQDYEACALSVPGSGHRTISSFLSEVPLVFSSPSPSLLMPLSPPFAGDPGSKSRQQPSHINANRLIPKKITNAFEASFEQHRSTAEYDPIVPPTQQRKHYLIFLYTKA